MTLAEQQAELVRALVARGGVPAGFDAARLEAAAHALLRKRADEVARRWPALMADPASRVRFLAWADGRPKTTTFEDGLAFALDQRSRAGLSPAARAELAHARAGRLVRAVRRHRARIPTGRPAPTGDVRTHRKG